MPTAPIVSNSQGNRLRLLAGPVPFRGIEYSQPHSSQPFPEGSGFSNESAAADAASFHGNDPHLRFAP